MRVWLEFETVGPLHLTIRDQFLRPLAGARVWLEHAELGPMGEFELGTDGVLQRPGQAPVGRYRIHISPPSMPVSAFMIDVAEATDTITLQVPAAAVQGILMYEKEPLAHAQVRVYRESEALPRVDVAAKVVRAVAYELAAQVETGADGSFEAGPVGFGVVQIEAHLADRILSSEPIEHRAGMVASTPIEVR